MFLCTCAQCGSLIDEKQRDDFVDEVNDEYADVREDHYDSLRDRRYLPLEQARARRLRIDFVQKPPAGK